MDLTIPYTFYPTALPHWLAWVLFSLAVGGSLVVCLALAVRKKTRLSLLLFFPLLIVLLFVSMVGSGIVMFFISDH